MILNWSKYLTVKRNKLRHRIRYGIPESVRSRVWALLMDANNSLQNGESVAQLLSHGNLPSFADVDQDIEASSVNTPILKDEILQARVRNILRAHCQLDIELGYKPGMIYFVVMLLTCMDDDIAFWTFHNILVDFKTLQIEYFIHDRQRLTIANNMFQVLLKVKLPPVHRHFEAIGIDVTEYTSTWFLLAFFNYNWSESLKFLLMDRFLFYGLRSLLSFALLIFSKLPASLSQSSKEEIIAILQNPHKLDQFENTPKFINEWDKMWIPKKKYFHLYSQEQKKLTAETN